MALWFPLYVNSQQIATVEIVRTKTAAINTYQWQVVDLQNPAKTAAGSLGHRYEDGALALVQRVLSDYQKVVAVASTDST